MIKNYHASLKAAGEDLRARHKKFIEEFAPKSLDSTEILGLFLTLVPVPFNTAAARFFGGGK